MDEAIVSTVVGKLSDLLIEEAEILNGVQETKENMQSRTEKR